MQLSERIAKVNEARKKALKDATFTAVAKEHQKAIESESQKEERIKRTRRKKAEPRRYADIYSSNDKSNKSNSANPYSF